MFGPYSHYYNGMMVGMPHQNPVPPTAHHPNPHQLSGHQPSHSWNQNQGFLNPGKIFLGKSLANVVSFYKDFTNADITIKRRFNNKLIQISIAGIQLEQKEFFKYYDADMRAILAH